MGISNAEQMKNETRTKLFEALTKMSSRYEMYFAPYVDEQNVYACGYLNPEEVRSTTGHTARLFTARTKMVLRRDYGLNLQPTIKRNEFGYCIIAFHAPYEA